MFYTMIPSLFNILHVQSFYGLFSLQLKYLVSCISDDLICCYILWPVNFVLLYVLVGLMHCAIDAMFDSVNVS